MANILVIDDEQFLLDLISATLSAAGHRVTALDNPVSAYDFIVAENEKIDLLLTDVSLTPFNGFELVRRLNLIGIDRPVLFTTGYSSLSSFIAQPLANRAVLEKPFTAPQLRAAVLNALKIGQSRPAAQVKTAPPAGR
jgi:DNA-binding NtrC family response regulator